MPAERFLVGTQIFFKDKFLGCKKITAYCIVVIVVLLFEYHHLATDHDEKFLGCKYIKSFAHCQNLYK